jgi:hypothetical protein
MLEDLSCMQHVLDLQEGALMESLTPDAGRTRTCLCPIEAGPWLEMTRLLGPCNTITPARSCLELWRAVL